MRARRGAFAPAPHSLRSRFLAPLPPLGSLRHVVDPAFRAPATLIVLALLLALLPAGCRRRETPAQAGLRTQTLLIGNGAEPADLDPQVITAYTDENLALALFEGLTAIDERTSEPAPAAAATWDTSADGLTWTFHLRPDLRWSNGEPLTAGDFIASWRRILDPALASEYAYLLYPLKNAERFNRGETRDPADLGCSAPDPGTLRLTLARPTPYLAALAAQPAWFPVNPRVLARFGAGTRRGTAWTRPGNLVGNGPFTLADWIPNARIVVVRNPAYWNASAVTLRRIVFFPDESPDTEERDFRAGQLHVTSSLPLTKLALYRRDAPARLRIDPFLQTFFLRFNTTRPPFDDPRVRRALALAIDRDRLTRTVLAGARPPAHTFTPPNCAGYTARARIDFDAADARRLLAAAGHPGGRGLAPIEVQVRNDDIQPAVMEAVQAMWLRELGVRVTLATLEQKSWIENQQTLNYGAAIAAWAGDFLDPVTFLDLFVTNGGNNWTGWKNAAYDRWIAAAAAAPSPGQRGEDFQQAEALLLAEAPITPLYFGAQTYLIDPAVHGWEPALLGFRRYGLVRLGK
jgi:oligopeptide transport system substrate-binding protein